MITPGQWSVALGIASMGLLGTIPGWPPVGAAILGFIVAVVAFGTWDVDDG